MRIGLWLRYDITYKGLENIDVSRKMIFLPNHPAEVDPVIVLTKLWNRYAPHPVVLEDFYYGTGLHWLMTLIRAIPMPNLWTSSGGYKRLRVQRSLDQIVDCLNSGDNVFIYPSGRLMHSGLENLRAVSGVHDILTKVPNANLILVRTTGLIGSSFSWVAQQKRPIPWECVFNGLIHLLANFIFFTPRRKVLVEFEKASPEFSACQDKMKLNKKLENWYNLRGEESIALVSYRFWKKEFFELKSSEDTRSEKRGKIPDEIRFQVIDELSKRTGLERDNLQDNQQLEGNLGLDSLGIAEILSWLEEEFFVTDIDAQEIRTVYDVMAAASGGTDCEIEIGPARISKRWTNASEIREFCLPDVESTIHNNFLQTCDKMKNKALIADDSSGVLSYHQAKIRVLILADIFKEFPDDRIGVMLPASTASTLTIFAILIAGKVPVMMNWTLGDRNLIHVLNSTKINFVLTSSRFLDKLDKFNIELVEKYLIILEDLGKQRVTLKRKLTGFYRAKWGCARLAKKFESTPIGSDDTAVILFTSGSESVPKGVPLTHRNILSNIRGCVGAVDLKPTDSVLAFLPPFHSFGFTITTILPAIIGIKAIYHPNPLESRRMVSKITTWKPTMICGTPTFVTGLLKAGQKADISSLRLILVGAEKAPSELFSKVSSCCEAELLEGYGITECSPVLTINRQGEQPTGVGKSIDGVEVCIVDMEKKKRLPRGDRGLILAQGPNIFGGYLDRDSQEVFVQIEGKRWYVTGDLGFITPNNCLVISGRLKRFVKVAGEMISLPAMEAALQEVYQGDDGEPILALSYLEKEGKRPEIFLFTTLDLTLEETNSTLKTAGFGNLARIKRVMKIDEIPVLGTGKTDYPQLRNLLSTN